MPPPDAARRLYNRTVVSSVLALREGDPEALAFGYWLAGLIDGEGCFVIERRTRKASSRWRTEEYRTYSCRFSVCLRGDDAPMIYDVAETTGFGSVYITHGPTAKRKGYPPLAIWQVSSREDCPHLIEILDHCPLRSKKATDYTIWRQAVTEWLSVTTPLRNRWKPGAGRDWSVVADLREQLMANRAYKDPA